VVIFYFCKEYGYVKKNKIEGMLIYIS